MMDEYGRLLAFQQTLEKETTDKIEFFGLSVDETITKCLLSGMSKRADKLKSDFKVPDKRYVRVPRVSHPGLLTTTTIQVLVPKAARVYCHPGL
jgi:Vps16, C-terminal region